MNKKMISILLLVMMIASCAPAYAEDGPTRIFINDQADGGKITADYGRNTEIEAELWMVSYHEFGTRYPHGKLEMYICNSSYDFRQPNQVYQENETTSLFGFAYFLIPKWLPRGQYTLLIIFRGESWWGGDFARSENDALLTVR
ncbi:hypothetical protein [Methanobacterium sp.]|uniref:hypothetical protein n=1 Tax=Methanobacterium sp. TaxID=2164 RepID=UPI003C7458B0